MSEAKRDRNEFRSKEPRVGNRANEEPEGMLLSLGELTDAAGVSVRTVRYYIAEGLLPPPLGTGPGSGYSPGHLDRLRLIQRMKTAYLPLKEIRRRLAGLTDDDVRALLAAGDAELPAERPADSALAGAREYLAMLESPARYRAEPLGLFAAPPTATERGAPVPADPGDGGDWMHADDFVPEPLAAGEGAPTIAQSSLWRRLALSDEAELVISERSYTRHRERVDWLVRWARKVFDGD